MKILFASMLTLLGTVTIFAQGASVRVAYIDMEYILKKVPEYIEANNQLEQRAQTWKKEMDAKKSEIKKFKDNLTAERSLLTRELIEEREEKIDLLQSDLEAYQQKRFGAQGDLITQKIMLVKPIQDQVFTVIQDIADAKRFDYVLDKASEATMLYATKRHDISEQVIQRLNRAKKRENLSGKEVAALEEEDKARDLEDLRREKREAQAQRKKEFESDVKKEKTETAAVSQAELQAQSKAEDLALLKQKQLQEAEDLRLKQETLAAEKLQAIADKKQQLVLKQEQLAEERRLAEELRKQQQKDKLQELEEQKQKIALEAQKKKETLDAIKKQREEEALKQTSSKEKIDVNQLVEERRKLQEAKQLELDKKKEIALTARREQMEKAKQIQEEKRAKIAKHQEEIKKARQAILQSSK